MAPAPRRREHSRRPVPVAAGVAPRGARVAVAGARHPGRARRRGRQRRPQRGDGAGGARGPARARRALGLARRRGRGARLRGRGGGRQADPARTRLGGVRDHLPGVARKAIHWKATARLGRLQTRVFEPATSGDIVFLVNVASHPSYWIQADPESVETIVSAASTLVRQAADEGRRFPPFTNGIDALTREQAHAVLGRGPARVRRGLEILARLSPYAAGTPEHLFLREQSRLALGATLVCVTPALTRELAQALVRLHRRRHRVLVVSAHPPASAVAAYAAAHRIALQSLYEARGRAAG